MAKYNRHATATKSNSVSAVADEVEEKTRQVTRDTIEYLSDYARQHPERAALWCLGVGFVLGWKLKPW